MRRLNELVRQAGNLRIKLQSRSAFLLRSLQLSLLKFANISNTDLLAEISENTIFSFIDHSLEGFSLLLEGVMPFLGLWRILQMRFVWCVAQYLPGEAVGLTSSALGLYA